MSLTAALTLGGSLAGGLFGSSSAKKSARIMAAAQDRATNELRRQYDTSRADFQPWRSAGTSAIGRLDRYLSGDDSDFFTSPDYEFRRTEGTRDIGNFFSGGPQGVYSGNAMRALNEFNSGLASGEIGNWYGRQMGVAEAGRGAAGTTAQLGAQTASQIAGNAMNAGRYAADANYAAGHSLNNAIQGGISNYLYGQGAGMWGQPKKKPVQNGVMINGGLYA